jgi:hypothetical protein
MDVMRENAPQLSIDAFASGINPMLMGRSIDCG